MYERLTVLYCEGWDGQQRAVVSPLPAAVARERDHTGEQYSVLLLGDGVPVVLLDVAWRSQVCLVWRFDSNGRREARYDLRRLDDRLMLVEQIEWRYANRRQPEMDDGVWRRTVEHRPDGRMADTVRSPGEGTQVTSGIVPPEQQPGMPLVTFGEWARLASITGAVPATAAWEEASEAPPTVAVSEQEQPPWRPPQPLQPGPLEQLFRDGSRFTVESGGLATVEVRQVGRLHVPTGRLVAADLGLLEDASALVVEVPPGAYPVELSIGRLESGTPLVLAAWLAIAPDPVTSWELALRPGEDPRVLGEEAFFGFGVDSGTACLVDAAAAGEAAAAIDAAIAAGDMSLFHQVQSETAMMVDLPTAGANLAAFVSGLGDGLYPVWIGRAADGSVAGFVADMLATEHP